MTDTYSYQGAQNQGSGVTDTNSYSFLIDQKLADIRTATLVKIVKAPYDKDGNTITPGSPVAVGYVDVLPLVNQLDGDGNATKHETVFRLSYYRYQGGPFAIIADPKVDDIGKMVIADRDTSSVRATNGQANPGSRRKFDMADGTFFGNPQGGVPTHYIAYDGNNINIVVPSGKKIVITGDVTVTGSITATGNITAGQGTGDQVTLQQHTHKDAGGTGNSGIPNAGT
jgi:hypothetical protein